MDEIFSVAQMEPFIVQFGRHINPHGPCRGLMEKDPHGKTPSIMGHRQEKRRTVLHGEGSGVCHLYSKVPPPIHPAVGGVNDCHVGVKAPHVAAVSIIFPIIAGEEKGFFLLQKYETTRQPARWPVRPHFTRNPGSSSSSGAVESKIMVFQGL